MSSSNQAAVPLFLLRLSIFLVMLMWTLDKFFRPGHAAMVFSHYYHLAGLNVTAMYLLGGLECLLILAFLLGYKKSVSYGLVFVIHAISTLSTFHVYLKPFKSNHLLFFAAWPMLAGCFLLWRMRAQDSIMVVDK